MISLLISLLVLALVIWLVIYIIGLIPLPEPFATIARVIIAILALVWVLGIFLGSARHIVL